ncbi:MAG: circularly permuted type 2 ATP-grasp protein [Desulfobacterales bacterium]|nr:circularly permuted type 2 ATP-grasp protein [Desulfobacterales bacterium]
MTNVSSTGPTAINSGTERCYGYTPPPSTYDELWSATQTVRRAWQPLIQTIDRLGCDQLERCHQEVTRMFRENGVAYNIHGDPQGIHRNWQLDILPLIIGRDDWETIGAGLQQRAHLLDLVLKDIYGPRRLVADGILPAELVFGHAGFLRPCHDVRLPTANQLLLYSADLARTGDGSYLVLADRTQGPFGMGHTLENRTALAKVMPDFFRTCKIQRLSAFFRLLRDELRGYAPRTREQPRIVLYAADRQHPAYFEQSYLGAYLNYPVVQGDDLTMRNGRVWLKTLYGLEPVDVILRMTDDSGCDPLELDPASSNGLAGLLEAARRNQVTVANPLGTGVLENPGLMAFLPAVTRYFLRQDLHIPSVPTWWCGRDADRGYVLENLDALIVKPIAKLAGERSVIGSRLTDDERREWRARIAARPHHYVGQTPQTLATAPVLVDNAFYPRPTLARLFALAQASGEYTLMPGGIARSSGNPDTHWVVNRTGGILKDIWVVASKPQKHASLWLQSTSHDRILQRQAALPSRTAENLFWVGRYTERAEMLARTLRTALRQIEDSERNEDEGDLESIGTLVAIVCKMASLPAALEAAAQPIGMEDLQKTIFDIITDDRNAGSLAASLDFMSNAAQAVRERWSSDSWRIVNDLEMHRLNMQRLPPALRTMQPALDRLVTSLLAFAGLCQESMSRELGWTFLDIGRRIERALILSDFIRRSLEKHQEPAVENMMLESVLQTTENIITYRRRYRSYIARNTVIDLLLLDDRNPRALIFQLDRIQAHIADLPKERKGYRVRPEERLALEAATRLRLSDTDQLCRRDTATDRYPHLAALLDDIRGLMEQVSETISHAYFVHTPKLHQLTGRKPEPGA